MKAPPVRCAHHPRYAQGATECEPITLPANSLFPRKKLFPEAPYAKGGNVREDRPRPQGALLGRLQPNITPKAHHVPPQRPHTPLSSRPRKRSDRAEGPQSDADRSELLFCVQAFAFQRSFDSACGLAQDEKLFRWNVAGGASLSYEIMRVSTNHAHRANHFVCETRTGDS